MNRRSEPDDLSPEYDFRDGVRGKYAGRFARASNVVILDPDVAEIFPSADDVNAALRALAGVIRRQARTGSS